MSGSIIFCSVIVPFQENLIKLFIMRQILSNSVLVEKMDNKSATACAKKLVLVELRRLKIIPFVDEYESYPEDESLFFSNRYVCVIQNGKWTFNVRDFFIFDKEQWKKGWQEIIREKEIEHIDTVFVFVHVGKKYGDDRFFIVKIEELMDIIHRKYLEWLKKHGNRRPMKKGKEFFWNIEIDDIKKYENKWNSLKDVV